MHIILSSLHIIHVIKQYIIWLFEIILFIIIWFIYCAYMHNKRDCSYDGLQRGKINSRGLNLKLKFPYVNEVFLKTLTSTREHMTWNVSFFKDITRWGLSSILDIHYVVDANIQHVCILVLVYVNANIFHIL